MSQVAAAEGLPEALKGLEPEALWRNIAALSAVPRPSKHETKVIQWLKEWADARKLEWQQDATGNVIIRRPGSGGGEQAPPVIIQGHVDMVCEKNSATEHDFFNNGIRLVRDGDWITADGTTLGSDNGIGVCAGLALLEAGPEVKLPPLEVLCTLDEETGLTGAFGLDGSLLKGRTLLNLDTEEWGEVFIGCAGGGDSLLNLTLATEVLPAGYTGLEVRVEGLMGGHSGVNIHEDRGNAVKMAAAAADAALAAAGEGCIVRFEGGDMRNAIPRECSVVLAVPADKADAAQAAAVARGLDFGSEFGHLEKGLSIGAAPAAQAPTEAITAADSARLLSLLLTLPHGVVKYSHAVEDLVETSSNLAAVKPGEGGHYTVICSTRSSLMPALHQVRRTIRALGELCGAQVQQEEAYPGWAPNPESAAVQLAAECIGEVAGTEAVVKAIHAGLECGILGERIPGVDCVSYGPTITGAHSPDERVQISTVEPFYRATLAILSRLADHRPAAAAASPPGASLGRSFSRSQSGVAAGRMLLNSPSGKTLEPTR